MSVAAHLKDHVSVQEYLRRERVSREKHEYHDGQVLAMAGATRVHVLVATNTIVALGLRLRGTPCVPYSSDLRIRLSGRPKYVYPDVSVICGSPIPDPDDDGLQTYLNPRLIIEVLSPSTEQYDRQAKFDYYRQLESFQEYVLISQDTARIETFFRQPDGTWRFDVATGVEAVARLRSLQIDLPLNEVFANVELAPADSPDDAPPDHDGLASPPSKGASQQHP